MTDSIPGFGRGRAKQLLAVIGLGKNMAKQFPTTNHLYSWTRMVNGNNESDGRIWNRRKK